MKRVAAFLSLVAAVPLALAACGADKRAATPAPAGSSAVPASPAPGPLSLAVTPAAGTPNLPISAEIGTTVTNGRVSEVTLVPAGGAAVAGSMREDGSSWVPAKPLDHGKSYTATVTATGLDGTTSTQTTQFTTMKRPGGSRVGTGLYLFSGNTYGVAMPVPVEFESDIPVEARASVVKRLFVVSEPAQPGTWRWMSPRMVLYRPPTYWQPNTKLTVRTALAGHPIGSRYGDTDRSATVTIGRKLTIEVDNATKQMNVFSNDALLKTFPVSLGKPKTPSSSGTMVIMSKEESTIFDTRATDGPDGYRIQIAYALRLTWKGQYIHSAPWSVRDQGVRNVSHGCVNLAPANALWVYQQTMVGDPVTVRGTERGLESGDGWTAWDLPWSTYSS
jgi:lipoprotein-anchoring transpeptidase ErfK/SrfK